MITFLALVVTVVGVLIAYFDWQGNVAERASAAASASASASASVEFTAGPNTAPTTSSSPSTTPVSTPTTLSNAPATSVRVQPTVPTRPHDIPRPPVEPAEDLRYRIDAAPVDPHTVKVTATASGQPDPGMTYWFILEVNWGGGNIDYYPRRKLTGRSDTFEVPIPPEADRNFIRQGRIYGLNGAQNTAAEARLERQSTSRVDEYFDNATGQVVSNAAKLPY